MTMLGLLHSLRLKPGSVTRNSSLSAFHEVVPLSLQPIMSRAMIPFVAVLLLATGTEAFEEVLQSEERQVLPGDIVSSLGVPKQVLELNQHIFAGNALQPMGGGSEQWVISFCPQWWEPCQQLEPIFSDLAASWQSRLNTDDFTLQVRFAHVDCAIDKVLCNEQGVEDYPTLAYYKGGRQVSQAPRYGRDMRKQLGAWVDKVLTPNSEVAAAAVGSASLLKSLWPGEHVYALDIALTLAALVASLRLVGCNPELWQYTSSACCASNAAGAAQEGIEARQPPGSWARILPQEWLLARRTIDI
ncbi:unnamed protein product [Polarella glacialis]|uniref:Thioredoxin domain-containing protein n=2 Tax=Polarella glacialis TaxID=89957 RepID=A0A813K0K0_POLGL|nr:unnamed protein product [Polarella glacialis]